MMQAAVQSIRYPKKITLNTNSVKWGRLGSEATLFLFPFRFSFALSAYKIKIHMQIICLMGLAFCIKYDILYAERHRRSFDEKL